MPRIRNTNQVVRTRRSQAEIAERIQRAQLNELSWKNSVWVRILTGAIPVFIVIVTLAVQVPTALIRIERAGLEESKAFLSEQRAAHSAQISESRYAHIRQQIQNSRDSLYAGHLLCVEAATHRFPKSSDLALAREFHIKNVSALNRYAHCLLAYGVPMRLEDIVYHRFITYYKPGSGFDPETTIRYLRSAFATEDRDIRRNYLDGSQQIAALAQSAIDIENASKLLSLSRSDDLPTREMTNAVATLTDLQSRIEKAGNLLPETLQIIQRNLDLIDRWDSSFRPRLWYGSIW